MKARLAEPLGCQPHLMRLILEGNELCDEGLLREHGVTDGAVIFLLRRGELHHIQWVLQRLMQVTSELQHAVTAHEEYEENLDDAADYFTLTARAAGSRTAPCWTALAVFAERLPVATDTLGEGGILGWAARNSAKPGRGGPEAWVLQARPSLGYTSVAAVDEYHL